MKEVILGNFIVGDNEINMGNFIVGDNEINIGEISIPLIQKGENGGQEIYDGAYDITPVAFQEQVLETKDKLLEENIKVKEIPFFETSNLYGNTVYIGSEV